MVAVADFLLSTDEMHVSTAKFNHYYLPFSHCYFRAALHRSIQGVSLNNVLVNYKQSQPSHVHILSQRYSRPSERQIKYSLMHDHLSQTALLGVTPPSVLCFYDSPLRQCLTRPKNLFAFSLLPTFPPTASLFKIISYIMQWHYQSNSIKKRVEATSRNMLQIVNLLIA